MIQKNRAQLQSKKNRSTLPTLKALKTTYSHYEAQAARLARFEPGEDQKATEKVHLDLQDVLDGQDRTLTEISKLQIDTKSCARAMMALWFKLTMTEVRPEDLGARDKIALCVFKYFNDGAIQSDRA